jgi:hypothetical protein
LLTGWPWVAGAHHEKRDVSADEVHADPGFTDEAFQEMVRDPPVDARYASAGREWTILSRRWAPRACVDVTGAVQTVVRLAR